jgi:hypothetical protein
VRGFVWLHFHKSIFRLLFYGFFIQCTESCSQAQARAAIQTSACQAAAQSLQSSGNDDGHASAGSRMTD